MSALTQIPEFYTTEFGINWEMRLQQSKSRLKSYVKLDTINGKEKTYNQMDSTTMRPITSRSGVTTPQDITLYKRWLRTSGFDNVTLFDEFDEKLLGVVTLPTSETVQAHAMAWERTCDQTIINALDGTAYSGETGTTANTLAASQYIAVDYVASGATANSGLTLAKLIKAKSILGINEVDPMEELVLVHTQKQLDDLLTNVTQVNSSDYNNVKALVDGNIDKFMGFKFVRTELCPLVTATDVRSIFAYVKSGVVLADGGKKVHMDIRSDLNHSLQIRTVANIGATRLQEKKVVRIYCDESP